MLAAREKKMLKLKLANANLKRQIDKYVPKTTLELNSPMNKIILTLREMKLEGKEGEPGEM